MTDPGPHVARSDDCCAVDPRIARHFDADMRRHEAAGTLPPMVAVSQRLLSLLDDVDVARPDVLELGCGSGALSVALLERGARRADGVDLSAASLAIARQRAEVAGVADRTRFMVGDAAQVPLERHDWLVLDRVMCCYAHLDRLLANSLGAAGRRVAFSVPHSTGWRGVVTRLIGAVENATNRLRGRPCPGYVHDIARIERRLADAGFGRLRHTTQGLWYIAVWDRRAAVGA